MRKLALSIGLLTLVVLLLASGIPQARQTDPQAEAGLKKLIESYQAAVEKQDLVAIMKCFAMGLIRWSWAPVLVSFMWAKNPLNVHRAFFSNYVKEQDKITWMKSGVNGNVAWIVGTSQIIQTQKKGENAFDMNWSAVLEKQGGEWKIVALHFSHLTGPGGPTPPAQGGAS